MGIVCNCYTKLAWGHTIIPEANHTIVMYTEANRKCGFLEL